MSTDYSVVITTLPNKESANSLAKALVEANLAACCQIDGPIESHYVWEHKTQCEQEFRLVIKTNKQLWAALELKINELHPYECPQIVQLPITQANAPYLNWMENCLFGQKNP